MRQSGLFLLAAVLLLLVKADVSPKLPSNVPRCIRDDPKISECLAKILPQAMTEIKGGIPSLGLPSIDPLHYICIEIKQGDGPVSINLKFSNITVFGLTAFVVDKFRANLKNFSLYFNATISNPVFEADYEMTGRMLLLPATGKGHCKLNFTDMVGSVDLKGRDVQKKGKTYFDVTEFNMSVSDLGGMHVHFDNLFNGDKVLGTTLNKLMNENWKELWMQLSSAFLYSSEAVFHQYTKVLFSKVPYNDIFID